MPVVRGEVLRAYVDSKGRARSVSRYTNTNVGEVKRMFLNDHPRAFFPSATAENRRATRSGGQEMDENPLGGRPVMHTVINPSPHGVQSEFTGLLKGRADVHIYNETSRGQHYTYVDETTAVRPNLHAIPVAGTLLKVAERVPVLGHVARFGREVAEDVGQRVFMDIHAQRVASDTAPAIARTLTKKNGR
jgi:hypothetical protein